MANAIWKDYSATLGLAAGGPYQFRIVTGGVTIYTGKAYGRPGASYVTTRINDICADYLTRNFPPEADDYYSAAFRVEIYSSGSWVLVASVTFAGDWSYDRDFTPGTDCPMDPIVPILHPQQYLPVWAPGGEYDFTLLLRPDSPGDFNNDFNNDFNYFGVESVNESDSGLDGDFQFFDLGAISNPAGAEVNGRTYKVADLCGGFVLYYINAYGGWDSIPVLGRAVRTDGVTRYTTDPIYNNNSYYARGRNNYVNEIAPKMRLTIGPLTTDQSGRMHHLLESNLVYLHDIEKGRIHPVVLTSNSVEHKTRPGTLHIYEFEVALAQNRIRR